MIISPPFDRKNNVGRHSAPTDAVRGQSLIMARWYAIFGQAITILVAFYGLGFVFPIVPAMAFVILSGVVNNYAYVKDHHRTMPPSRAFFYLTFDVLQLTSLLYLTGGISNPFSVLLLAPVLVGASILSRHYMIILLSIGLLSAIIISFFSIPLVWPSQFDDNPEIHSLAESIGIAVTIIFTGFYAWRIAEESRSILTASHAAKTALLKQRQLQALGAQAAAAVHELGSPLGTITIVAKELSLELGDNHPQIDDVHLLIDQTKRCQSILRDFGATLRHDPSYLSTPTDIATILKNITSEFLKERPEIRFLLDVPSDLSDIKINQSAEIIHGIGVFVQNAIQFAKSQIRISASLSKNQSLTLKIEDDGVGFAPHILSKLGEPYTSTRTDSEKNMGLGIFIAQTLLEETGANISYNNLPQGGAQVIIGWKKESLLQPNNKI